MRVYRWRSYVYRYNIKTAVISDFLTIRYCDTITHLVQSTQQNKKRIRKITTEQNTQKAWIQNRVPELHRLDGQKTDSKQSAPSSFYKEGRRGNEELANFRSKTSNFIKKEAEVIWRWCSTVNMSQIECISAKLYSTELLRGLAMNLHTSKLTLETGAEVWHIEILSTAVVSDSRLCVVKGTVASNPQTLRCDHFQAAPSHSQIWQV